MHKGRLEAFSDGVIAIIITIMMLDLHAPVGNTLTALRPLSGAFMSYVLSFGFIGIYWNNHHHLLQAAHKVNGKILWANLHLLFWLSLIPFTTAWMGQNHFTALPVALYGMVLFSSACAYYLLAHLLLTHHGGQSTLAEALGNDSKGKISIVIYTFGIVIAFRSTIVAILAYTAVAIMWLIPDRRLEKRMS